LIERARIEAGCSDSWKSIGELDADEVDRRAGLECYEGGELISHWIGFGDGALGQHGQDCISRKSTGGAYGMRGDSLGRTHCWCARWGRTCKDWGGDGNIWGLIRERDAGVVDRRAGLKRDSGRELTSYCIGFGNSARSQHWEDIWVGLSMDTLSSRPQTRSRIDR